MPQTEVLERPPVDQGQLAVAIDKLKAAPEDKTHLAPLAEVVEQPVAEELVMDADKFNAVPEHGGDMQSLVERYGNNPGACPYIKSLGAAGVEMIERWAVEQQNPNRDPTMREILASKLASQKEAPAAAIELISKEIGDGKGQASQAATVKEHGLTPQALPLTTSIELTGIHQENVRAIEIAKAQEQLMQTVVAELPKQEIAAVRTQNQNVATNVEDISIQVEQAAPKLVTNVVDDEHHEIAETAELAVATIIKNEHQHDGVELPNESPSLETPLAQVEMGERPKSEEELAVGADIQVSLGQEKVDYADDERTRDIEIRQMVDETPDTIFTETVGEELQETVSIHTQALKEVLVLSKEVNEVKAAEELVEIDVWPVAEMVDNFVEIALQLQNVTIDRIERAELEESLQEVLMELLSNTSTEARARIIATCIELVTALQQDSANSRSVDVDILNTNGTHEHKFVHNPPKTADLIKAIQRKLFASLSVGQYSLLGAPVAVG